MRANPISKKQTNIQKNNNKILQQVPFPARMSLLVHCLFIYKIASIYVRKSHLKKANKYLEKMFNTKYCSKCRFQQGCHCLFYCIDIYGKECLSESSKQRQTWEQQLSMRANEAKDTRKATKKHFTKKSAFLFQQKNIWLFPILTKTRYSCLKKLVQNYSINISALKKVVTHLINISVKKSICLCAQNSICLCAQNSICLCAHLFPFQLKIANVYARKQRYKKKLVSISTKNSVFLCAHLFPFQLKIANVYANCTLRSNLFPFQVEIANVYAQTALACFHFNQKQQMSLRVNRATRNLPKFLLNQKQHLSMRKHR